MLERRIDGQAGRQSEAWKAEESFEVRDRRKQGWFWSYDAVFDLQVSAHAKLVYLCLCRRASRNGNAYCSRARIARDCSLSTSAVKRAIRALAQAGVIRVTSRKNEGLHNIYHLIDLSEWRGGVGHTDPPPGHIDPPPGHTDPPLGLHTRTIHKDSLSRTQKEREDKRTQKESWEELVRRFYANLGQPKTSCQKVEKESKILANLEGEGFSREQITWGMEWILRHPEKFNGEVYSLRLLPEVMGQALKEAEQVRRAEEKRQQQDKKERRLREEQTSRVALGELYQSLPPEEQASLRERAVENLVQQGVKKTFLVEPLVRGEICRLLGERERVEGTFS